MLHFARSGHTFADRLRRFFGAFTGDVAVFDRRHFDMQIDSIEQRSGDTLAITLHLHRSAAAFAFQVAKVTAGTGIHCGHEHKLGRKGKTSRGARDRHFSIFQWLPHHFQGRSFELRQLIEKENAIAPDAACAGSWNRAAAEKADVANGVMRRAEWTGGNKRAIAIKQARDAVDLGRFNRFIERHRWNDRGDAFRQHRFARAGRTDHENVVPAGNGHFDRAFDGALSFYVGKIDLVVLVRGEKIGQVTASRKKRELTAHEFECLPQILHAVDVDLVDHGGLARVGFRHEQGALAAFARFQRDRQDTFDRPHRAIQCEFPDKREILERRAVDFFGDGDHSERDRQIESRAFLFDISRRQIHRRASARPTIAAVSYGRGYAVETFFHGRIGQPDNENFGVAVRAVYLHFDFVGVDAVDGGRINLCQHWGFRLSKVYTGKETTGRMENAAFGCRAGGALRLVKRLN